MAEEDKEHLEKMLQIYQRRLKALEEKSAFLGVHEPVDYAMERQDLAEQIKQLRKKLAPASTEPERWTLGPTPTFYQTKPDVRIPFTPVKKNFLESTLPWIIVIGLIALIIGFIAGSAFAMILSSIAVLIFVVLSGNYEAIRDLEIDDQHGSHHADSNESHDGGHHINYDTARDGDHDAHHDASYDVGHDMSPDVSHDVDYDMDRD